VTKAPQRLRENQAQCGQKTRKSLTAALLFLMARPSEQGALSGALGTDFLLNMEF
jgi:hypothetical protein